MIFVYLVLGLILLVAGGEFLVKGAVNLAGKFRISPLLIGLTLVGFGTSTPELVTSLQAAFAGSPGIAIGNVVGSNIANILFILGAAALIFPIAVARNAFKRDGVVLAIATLLCIGAVVSGQLSRWMGIVFVIGLAAYIWFAFQQDRKATQAATAAAGGPVDTPKLSAGAIGIDLVFVVGGLVMTMLGARFLVSGAIDLARMFSISETIIGLTIVAVGTSLPELITSVMASLRKQGDIAFGNIVGSNIYNMFGILGVTAIVKPIPVPAEIIRLDIWVMLAATVLLFLAAMSRWRIGRTEGAIMLTGYAAYVVWLGLHAAA
ncbi:K+-dependent Na+/Ca+ exchanger-like protein [Hyphomonas polymorpha PS728]|uniref:K+-dependent Na+/Ca+ exchanger-like protein n=1 Tax=Hyphomonas polymorpha PS728 TaxID=1280954 RepID=A0A062VCH0_9PROT|nr:calcium/sodium antiporter [Hyphomonas polymorpha]KCZ97083.1 K+-dependent Na+/Ca+ exchanger-like protein [Hyphomonas polymorpha PS728]